MFVVLCQIKVTVSGPVVKSFCQTCCVHAEEIVINSVIQNWFYFLTSLFLSLSLSYVVDLTHIQSLGRFLTIKDAKVNELTFSHQTGQVCSIFPFKIDFFPSIFIANVRILHSFFLHASKKKKGRDRPFICWVNYKCGEVLKI